MSASRENAQFGESGRATGGLNLTRDRRTCGDPSDQWNKKEHEERGTDSAARSAAPRSPLPEPATVTLAMCTSLCNNRYGQSSVFEDESTKDGECREELLGAARHETT